MTTPSNGYPASRRTFGFPPSRSKNAVAVPLRVRILYPKRRARAPQWEPVSPPHSIFASNPSTVQFERGLLPHSAEDKLRWRVHLGPVKKQGVRD